MNEHESLALKLMKREYNDLIGGCENDLENYSENSEEYQIAYKTLYGDQERLLDRIYNWTTGSANQKGYAKHIRFAGEEWLKNQIKEMLIKDGYYKES